MVDADTNKALPNATVYIDFPELASTYKTNANGEVKISGESGTFTVAAYKQDYLPSGTQVEIEKKTTKTITIAD